MKALILFLNNLPAFHLATKSVLTNFIIIHLCPKVINDYEYDHEEYEMSLSMSCVVYQDSTSSVCASTELTI